MYNKISSPVNEVYDAQTNEFLGYSRFELPPSEEEKLLQFFNYGRVPETLILLNVDFSDIPKDYVPPELTQKLKRRGILRALLIDTTTGERAPVEVYLTFDVRGRGNQSGNIYHFDSLEYSDIKIDRVNYKE